MYWLISFATDYAIVYGIDSAIRYVIDYAIGHIIEKEEVLSLNWLLHCLCLLQIHCMCYYLDMQLSLSLATWLAIPWLSH